MPKFVTYKFPVPSIVKYSGLFNPVANVVNLSVVSYVNIGPRPVVPFVDIFTLPVPHNDGTVTCNWVEPAVIADVSLPLIQTLSCDGEALKPEPVIVTVSPTVPCVGLMLITTSVGVELVFLLQLGKMPSDRHRNKNEEGTMGFM